MASLECLPQELWQDICGFLAEGGVSELRNFSRASKRCCAAADPKRFQHIRLVISTESRLELCLNRWVSLLGRRQSYGYVRRVSIGCYCAVEYMKPGVESAADITSFRCQCPKSPSEYNSKYPQDDYFYCHYDPNPLTPTELDDEDDLWWSVAMFLSKLTGLRDIFYFRQNQFPRCILTLLRLKLRRCRLHICPFILHYMVHDDGDIDEYGFVFAKLPNLYSVSLAWHWSREMLDYGDEIPLQLVGELSPSIREISLVRGVLPLPQVISPGEHSPWRHRFEGRPQPDAIKPKSLEKLAISNCYMASLDFVQAWSRYTLFSSLRSLLLPEGVPLDTLIWLRECQFQSLETLVICIYGEKFLDDDETLQQTDEAGAAFLKKLLPLKELQINGSFGQGTFKAILERHGTALRQLSFSSCFNLDMPIMTVDMIDGIRLRCHELRVLSLPIKRSQSDSQEVDHYRALGKFTQLEELDIQLGNSGKHSRREFIFTNAYVRAMVVNYAVDSSLVRSIANIVGSGESALKRLTLKTWGLDTFSGLPRTRISSNCVQFLMNIDKGWRCTWSGGHSDVVVEDLGIIKRKEGYHQMISTRPRLLLGKWRYSIPSTLLASSSSLTPAVRTFHASSIRRRAEDAPEYEYIEDCERLERYSPGGYYPVKLGDRLCDGRYCIVHNLGFGGSSTVWLASDQKQQRLVAIKIRTADSVEESEEEDILIRLRGQPSIRQLLDTFIENSPNGAHRCLVMEATGCSLTQSKLLAAHELLSLTTARAIIADLVLAVQSLHGQGIVHGDIHCGNLLLRLPADLCRIVNPLSLYQKFGNPILEPIVRVDRKPLPAGVPTHIIGPVRMGIRSDQITDSHLPVILSDFGSSYCPDKTRRVNARTLPHLVPPEAFFVDEQKDEDRLSFPSEIWTLGCIIFEIIGGGGPFSILGGGILQDQVCVLGKLPEPWWLRWESRAEFFNEDATVDMATGATPFKDSLEDRYNWFVRAARRRSEMEEQGEDEKRAFLHMIETILRYSPRDRATIQDIVDSEWMQTWALPLSTKRQR
ncbi:hypothetical protein McanCB56680_005116 [Microsporum canis]